MLSSEFCCLEFCIYAFVVYTRCFAFTIYAVQSFVATSLLLFKIFIGPGNLFPPCVHVLIIDENKSTHAWLS